MEITSKRLHFVFSTTRQWNPGDEFILRGVFNIFKALGVSFTPIIYNRNPDIQAIFQRAATDTGEKLEIFDNSVKPDSDLSYVDLVVFAGTPDWHSGNVDRLHRLILRYKIPAVFLGIGGPASNVSEYCRAVLASAPLITVRQTSVLSEFQEEIQTAVRPVYLTCPAMLSADKHQEKVIMDVSCIGLIYQASKAETNSINGVSDTCYENEKGLFCSIIEKYYAEKRIIIICHYVDEIPLAMRDFPGQEICYSYDAADYYEIYRQCDIVVGTRVHGIGIAASLGIPGLALSHDLRGDTAIGFGAEVCPIGQDKLYIDYAINRFERLVQSAVERSQMLKKLKRETLERYTTYISKAIETCIGTKINYQEIPINNAAEFVEPAEEEAPVQSPLSRIIHRFTLQHDYYGDLMNRINLCDFFYRRSPRQTALRMIWWNTKILIKHVPSQKEMISSKLPLLDENKFNVGFVLGGGIGDMLMNTNYIAYFRRRYGCPEMNIDVYLPCNEDTASAFLEPGLTCDRFFPVDLGCPERYDLFIRCTDRYPHVVFYNSERIKNFQNALLEYISVCQAFLRKYPKLILEQPHHDGRSGDMCLAEGKKRLQQPDIDGLLGIGTEYLVPIHVHQDEQKYLTELGLENRPFITLHRGTGDMKIESVKMWPLAYYNDLVGMLKREYPDIPLVQLGINANRCPAMNGIDINLVDKTTLEDVKVLLHNALLHIDCEGGYVHFRRALGGGPSIVLFGPTSLELYGFQKNINIRGDGCQKACEWSAKGWYWDRCLRNIYPPPCMASIYPEQVMAEIRHFLSKSKENRENG